MRNWKRWRVPVYAVAALVLIVVAWRFRSDGRIPRTADSVLLVDVVTGDRFRADVSGRRGIVIPATHPETGEPTLYPADEREGALRLVERYAAPLNDLEGELAVDRETLDVRVSEARVRALR